MSWGWPCFNNPIAFIVLLSTPFYTAPYHLERGFQTRTPQLISIGQGHTRINVLSKDIIQSLALTPRISKDEERWEKKRKMPYDEQQSNNLVFARLTEFYDSVLLCSPGRFWERGKLTPQILCLWSYLCSVSTCMEILPLLSFAHVCFTGIKHPFGIYLAKRHKWITRYENTNNLKILDSCPLIRHILAFSWWMDYCRQVFWNRHEFVDTIKNIRALILYNVYKNWLN